MAVTQRVGDWLDERLESRAISSALLDRLIPEGVSWLQTLGSAGLLIFVIQAVTGTFLAMNYSPSPEHAYDSVIYITEEVPFGGIVRGLHKWGASAMVVVVFLHMLRTYFMGSYKYPRELTWVVGVFILFMVLGFGFTGYLLPWDQKAYWATAVGTNIAEQTPLIGEFVLKILRGGLELGAVTLTRFYALHVLLLPALLIPLIGVHLFMVVKQGIAAPPKRDE
jgi:quinol-cytochrome oxidoreductase complex cytochrome b subunit